MKKFIMIFILLFAIFSCGGSDENGNSNTIDALREEVVKNAHDILNRKPRPRYVWGATGPNSYDCSGFTSELLKKIRD